MSDTATLVGRLRERSASYMAGRPSSAHTFILLDESAARIVELEAERDRLKAELAKAGHDFVAIERIARTALSDPSGEKP